LGIQVSVVSYCDIIRSLVPGGDPVLVYDLHFHPEMFSFFITESSG